MDYDEQLLASKIFLIDSTQLVVKGVVVSTCFCSRAAGAIVRRWAGRN